MIINNGIGIVNLVFTLANTEGNDLENWDWM